MSEMKTNKGRTLMLMMAVFAMVMVCFAGALSDDSDAAVTKDVQDGSGTTIGTWTYDNATFSINASDSTKVPVTLADFTEAGISDASTVPVTVSGFSGTNSDAIISLLTSSDYGFAESNITFTHDVISASGKIGSWTYEGTTLTLTPSATTSDVLTEIIGFSSWSSLTGVVVQAESYSSVAFKGDFSTFFKDKGVSTTITYTGDIPVNGTTAGTWSYVMTTTSTDVSYSSEITLTANSPGSLYNSYTDTSTTIWNGFFFTDKVTTGVIHIYTSGGAYIFLDFPKMDTITSDSLTSFSKSIMCTLADGTVDYRVTTMDLSAIQSINSNHFYQTKVVYVKTPAVTSIGSQTFDGVTTLKSITVSPSISTISGYAFRNCSSLESINSTGTVTTIGEYAFYNCASLKSINLSSSLTTINTWAFADSGLTSIVFPSKVITISDRAFSSCTDLASVSFSSSLMTIGSYAFYNTAIDGSIAFSSTLTSIGSYAFADCTSLDQVHVNSSSAIVISGAAFVGCSTLRVAELKDDVSITLNDSAFGLCPTLGKTETIDDVEYVGYVSFDTPVLTVGTKCFSGCTGLVSLDFSKCATSISSGVCTTQSVWDPKTNGWVTGNRCVELTTVKFGSLESSIGNSAFGDWTGSSACSNLKYLDLGSNITSIGEYAFCNCVNLLGASVKSSSVDDSGETVYTYYPVKFPATLKTLKIRAFYGCTNLTGIEFQEGCQITEIPEYCFEYDRNITSSITIPTSVKEIKVEAFYQCYSLTSVSIPSTVLTSIGSSSFGYCNSMKSVTISSNVLQTISSKAFQNCPLLTTVTLTSSALETIGDSAFINCKALSGDIKFGAALTSIGSNAFNNCWELGNITFAGSNLKTIGSSAFACDYASSTTYRGPESVILPDSLTSIGGSAFQYCTKMTKVVVGWDSSSPENLGNNMFYYCVKLVSAEIHSGVVSLGTNCFYNCTALTSVSLADTVTTIPAGCFNSCTSLVSIDLNKVTTIGSDVVSANEWDRRVFYGDTLLESVKMEYAEYIYDYSFRSLSKLTSVSFGNTLKEIGTYAFYEDYYLTNISLVTYSDTDVPNPTFTLYCNGLYDGKELVLYASGRAEPMTIREDTTDIRERVCYNSKITGELVIPSKVDNIGRYAFYNSDSITSVKLLCTKADVFDTIETTISDETREVSYAFVECSNIKKLTIPNTVKIGYVFCTNNNWQTQSLTDVEFTGTGASGLGSYYETYYNALPWYWSGSNINVVFSGKITSVDSYIFHGNTRVKTITFCDSVQSIGACAFDGLKNLTTLVLPAGLKTIDSSSDKGTFGNSNVTSGNETGTNLKEFTCPTSFDASLMNVKFTKLTTLTMIQGSGSAVSYTAETALKTPWYYSAVTGGYDIIFDSSVSEVGAYTFYQNSNFETVTFSDAVKTIGAHAFDGCSYKDFDELWLPAEISSIGTDAFANCTKLKDVYLPITYNYDSEIFTGCVNLNYFHFTEGTDGYGYDYTASSVEDTYWYQISQDEAVTVYVLDGVKSLGNYMFYGCSSISAGGSALGISRVTLPDTMVSIGESVFENCSNLSDVTMGTSLEEIGDHAFKGCSYMTSITLPSTFTTLGKGAFSGCTLLSSIEIPISVNCVVDSTDYAFSGCSNLNTYSFIGAVDGHDYVDSSSSGSYYALAPWNMVSTFSVSFTDVLSIGDYMFDGRTFSSATLKLPDSVTSIGEYAFANTLRLTTVCDTGSSDIDDLVAIGAHAFENSALKYLNSTKSVSLANVTSIGEAAFEKSKVIDVVIGTAGSTLAIGDYAFCECSDLKTFVINSDVASLPYNTFRSKDTSSSYSSVLTTLTVPCVARFYASLADDFKSLQTVDISGSTTFGTNAGLFRNCTSLTTVSMNTTSATAYDIPQEMFKGCVKLSTIDLSKVNMTKGHEFDGCTNLTSVSLDSTSKIPDYAFNGCSSLVSVTAPRANTVSSYAFYGTKIASITSDSFAIATSFGDYSFAENTNLHDLQLSDNLQTIGAYAFYECTNLDNSLYSKTLETKNVTSIGAHAFDGTQLSIVSIGEALLNLGEGAINIPTLSTINVDSNNTSFASDDGILYVTGFSEMIQCPALINRSVTLNDNLVTIRAYAAENASITETLTIPAGVTTIGARAFANSSVFKLVFQETSDKVTVGTEAFANCGNLTQLILNYSTGYANVFTGSSELSSISFIGSLDDSMRTYYTKDNCSQMPWYSSNNGIALTFAATITEIYDNMFYHATEDYTIESVAFNDGTATIGASSFYNCNGLTSLVLPKTIRTLKDQCFDGCHGIQNLTVPIDVDLAIDSSGNIGLTGLVQIEFIQGSTTNVIDYSSTYTNAIWYRSLTPYKVIIDEGITELGNGMHLWASDLSVPSTLTTIGTYAFTGSTLTTLDLKNVQTIKSNAFQDCDGLTSLVIPSGIKDLGTDVFSDCDKLQTLAAPITYAYSEDLFSNCPLLGTFSFTAGSTGIGADYTGIHASSDTPWNAAMKYETALNPVISFNGSIKSIGNYMFADCYYEVGTYKYGLATLTLPTSIEALGDHAYEGCKNATSTNLSGCSSLKTIGGYAFNGCSGLINGLTIASAVETIGEYAFAGCSELTSITIPVSVTSIGEGSFSDCSKVATLTIPIHVNAVASSTKAAFSGTSSIRAVTFVGNSAHAGYSYSEKESSNTPWALSKTSAIVFNDGIPSIGSYTFNGCSSFSGSVTLPSSVTSVGAYAFAGTSISTFTGNAVETIGEGAFKNTTVQSVTLSSRLTTVPASAFYGCSALTRISAGNITSIGSQAFMKSGIRTLGSKEGTVSFTSVTSVGNQAFAESGVVNVVLGTAGTPITTFGTGVFLDCAELESVDIEGDVPLLSADTFRNSSSTITSVLRSVTADKATAVEADFSGFAALESVSFTSATSYGSGTFKNCTSLVSVGLYSDADSSVRLAFAKSMFENCAQLSVIDLTNVDLVNERTFYGCSSITAANIPFSATVPAYSFYGCSSLATVTATVAGAVGDFAFYGSGLTAISSTTFPAAVSFGSDAFNGCSSMTSVIFSENLTSIGANAFMGTSISEITNGTMPSVTFVGVNAFKDVTTLGKTLTMDNVAFIGDNAFDGTSLTAITVGDALLNLGDLAFRDASLASVTVPDSNPNFCVVDGVLYNKDVTTLILVPAKLYLNNYSVPDTVTTVLHYAAYKSSLGGTLTLPSSITLTASTVGSYAVADYAFADSSDITALNLQYTGKNITASTAFSGCANIASLTVSNTVQLGNLFDSGNKISEYHFFGTQVSGLETYYESHYMEMPWANAADGVKVSIVFDSGTTVDPYMFYFAASNTTITSIDLGSVTTIGNNAFTNCSGMETLIIPDSVKSISASSLNGCSGIKHLTLPISLSVAINTVDSEGHHSVGELALADLHFTPGETMKGASYTTNYESTLWYSATTNYEVYFDEGIQSIGDCMYLKPLSNVNFPSTLTSIGSYAFYGSTMNSVTLKEGLTYIGDKAFANTQISKLTIPDSLDDSLITTEAPFEGCSMLTEVTLPISINYANDMFKGCTIYTFNFTKGTGTGADYTESSVLKTPWYSTCKVSDIVVTFGSGIDSIGDYMFCGCNIVNGSGTTGLAGDIVLDSVKTIGTRAFSGCAKMSSVTFGTSISVIEDHAFDGCSGLKSLSIGESITKIGAGSFSGCTGILTLRLPLSLDTVVSSSDPAFGKDQNACASITKLEFIGDKDGCSSYKSTYQYTPWYSSSANSISVSFAGTIPSIGEYTFYNCTGLDGTVSLPSSITSVGACAFSGCSGIDEFVIGASITSVNVGKAAFAYCSDVRSLTLPISMNAVVYSGTDAIFYGTSDLTSLHFTGSVGISYSTTSSAANYYQGTPWFCNKANNMSVVFDRSVTSIGDYMFSGCSALQGEVSLYTVSSIGAHAFEDCDGMTVLTADNVTSVGANAFAGCDLLYSASLVNLRAVSQSMFEGTTNFSSLTLSAYCSEIGASAFYQSGVRNINKYSSDTADTVNLPYVTKIGDKAFAESGVVNVNLGGSVPSIGTWGSGVFSDCYNLKTLTVDSIVTTLPNNTFRSGSSSFTSSMTRLSAKNVTNFFADMSGFKDLVSVDISGTISFGNTYTALFKDCTSLTDVTLFNGSASSYKYTLPSSMFEGCTALKNINLDYANLNWGDGREFYGCESLESVTMLYSSYIPEFSFYGCTSLKEVSMPRATLVGIYAFAESGLVSIEEGDLASVTTIYPRAFLNCISLEEVVMPAVTNIQPYSNVSSEIEALDASVFADTDSTCSDVFKGCTALQKASFEKIGAITDGTFYNCNKLVEVKAPAATSIEVLAFYNCNSLTSVTFESVTTVGDLNASTTYNTETGTFTDAELYSVFYNCSVLSEVEMPKVAVIGTLAFYNCDAMVGFNSTNGIFLGSTVSDIGIAAFAGTGASSVTIGSTDARGNTSGLTSMSDYVFFKCTKLQTFSSPSLTSLPAHTFNFLRSESTGKVDSQLISISVPSVTRFYADLHGITSLSEVSMPSAYEFSDEIFYGCTGLKKVTLVSSDSRNTPVLTARMFYGCTQLSEINLDYVQLPTNVTAANSGSVFFGCVKLTSVNMLKTTCIPASAFQNCTGLKTVTAPAATVVGISAFNGCNSLTTFDGSEVTSVRDHAFDGCTSLTTLNPSLTTSLDDGTGYNAFMKIEDIGAYAFSGCGFTSITFGPTLTSLGSYAFYKAKNLSEIVLPNSLNSIPSYAFSGCPLTTVHISSSVVSIATHAFDYNGTTSASGTSAATYYFNGAVTDSLLSSGSIYGNSKITMNFFCTVGSKSILESHCLSEHITNVLQSVITEEYSASIVMEAEDNHTLPYTDSYSAIYGGKVVLPFYSSGSNSVYYYFATQNGGTLAIFASSDDYDDGRIARSGDAIPVYPLEDGGMNFHAYTDAESLNGKWTVTITSNGNGNEVTPASTPDVYYGATYTIPTFTNPLAQVSQLDMVGPELDIELDVSTKEIIIGYSFNECSLQSKDTKVNVTFIRGDDRYPTQVLLRSSFTTTGIYSSDETGGIEIVTLEDPDDGYYFVGWYTAASGGIKAGDDTKFLSNQVWYARFAPETYSISVTSGDKNVTIDLDPIQVTGPFKLYVDEDNVLYYTDLDHTTKTYIISSADIQGYDVSLYFDSDANRAVTEDYGPWTSDRHVVVSVTMLYYEVDLKFTYMGETVEGAPFYINNWQIGSQESYTSGDKITNVPFTKFKDGLVIPSPLNEVYSLYSIYVNGKNLPYTSSAYILTADYIGTSNVVDITFALEKGKYTIHFDMKDDAKTLIENSESYVEGSAITMAYTAPYVKVGYTFEGFKIEGLDYTWKSMQQVNLSAEMIAQSKYCVITFVGLWTPVEYTVNFNLGSYTGTTTFEPLEGQKIGDTINLTGYTVDDYIGHTIASWHWIKGETVGTATYTGTLTIEKSMIENYASDDNTITLQCDWGSKTYSLVVDSSSGISFVTKTGTYNETFQLWNIGNYTRAFMKFNGWQVGPESEGGSIYENQETVVLNDEMATYAESHNGEVVFYFSWIYNEYTVQYNVEGCSGTIPSDYKTYTVESTDFALPVYDEKNPSFYRDGYSFLGWKYSQNSTTIYTNTTGKFDQVLAQSADSNGIVTFYAVWSQKSYNIVYNLKGGISGSYAPSSAMYGDDVTISAPSNPGYKFLGWKATYKVSSDDNTPKALTSGAAYRSSSNLDQFWDGSRTVNVTTFKDLCSVDGAIVTFEAMWDYASFNISYTNYTGYGTLVNDDVKVIKIGESITLASLRDASKPGYSFAGWSIDGYNVVADGTVLTTQMVEGITNESLPFIAVWDANSYTVSYRYTEEQSYIDMTTTFDATVPIPTYSRTGYTFAGWSISGTDSYAKWSYDGEAWYTLGSAVVKGTYFKSLTSEANATVTIDALWTSNQYRIAYSSNGGTGTAPVDKNTYVIGSTVTLADYTSLIGTNGNKSIIGWSLDTSGAVTSFTSFSEGLASRADATNTVMLYAAWVEGLCTVTVDLDGGKVDELPSGWTATGEGIYTTSVEYGTAMKTVMEPWDNVSISKDGCNFTGWKYGSGNVVSNVTVTPTYETVDMNIAYIFAGVIVVAFVGVIAFSRFRI